MYILNIGEQERETQWLCFETLEDGRAFMKLLPGYHFIKDEEDGEIESEWLDPMEMPDYCEIPFHGNIIPVSRYMFRDFDKKADLYFREVPNLSMDGHGIVKGYSIVDAYAIPNDQMGEYITDRERLFKKVQAILEDKHYVVERAYHGSEDGEAITYQKPNDPHWYFLEHMDPSFVALAKESDESIKQWVIDHLI